MPELTLSYFGHPTVQVHDQPIEIKMRKGIALLAYLSVVENGRSPRDVLATLLWPDYTQVQARTNLRRLLYLLNRTPIAPWLEADLEFVALRRDETVRIDARQFAQLVGDGAPEALAQAAALYRADFLAGFYLPDSGPFEEWTAVQREHYRRQALDALHALAEYYLAQQAFAAAEAAARRLLQLDDLRESAWRQLMTALAGDGRRAEALVVYETCRQHLHDELQIEPSSETATLAETLRKDAGNQKNQQVQKTTLSPAPLLPRPSAPSTPPYRGLFAFQEEDAPYFFGREEFTDFLVTAVHQQAIVAVIGPSGSGKSSVVNAGLLPQIRPALDWQIASFRPEARPFYALAETLIPLLEPGLSQTDKLIEAQKLADALAQRDVQLFDVITRILPHEQVASNGQGRLLLFADQFEELFTLCPDAALRHNFLDVLLDPVFQQLYRPAPIFNLVLTLRADFVGQALAYRPLADVLQDGDVKLGPMSRPELTRAIVNPASLQEVAFEAGLATRLLDDVGEEPGNLPLLQFALASLWEQRNGARLTHAAYEAIGMVEGALAQYAEETFIRLDDDEQTAVRRIFVQLVRPGEGTEDTRRLATRTELGDELWPLVQQMADARLVVTGHDALGQETVEIVHEALIRNWFRLRDWLTEDRAFRIWQERLRAGLRAWQDSDQDAGLLLRGTALEASLEWLAERPQSVSLAEAAFINAGAELRRQRRAEKARQQAERERLRRRITQVLLVGLAVAVILAAAALAAGRQATQNADDARGNLALAVTREAEAVDNFNLAVTQEARALENADLAATREAEALAQEAEANIQRANAEAEAEQKTVAQAEAERNFRAAQRALLAAESLNLLSAGSSGELPALLAVESLQIGYSPEAHAALYRALENGFTRLRLEAASRAVPIVFSPDGQFLLTTGDTGGPRLWNLATGEEALHFEGHEGGAGGRFSSDGSLIVTGGNDGTIGLWETATGLEIRRWEAHDDLVNGVAFTPDETQILSVSDDQTAKLWDAETGELLRTYAVPPLEGRLNNYGGTANWLFGPEFSSDGRTFLTGSSDLTVREWDVDSGEVLRTFTLESGIQIQALAYSPDERFVMGAPVDNTVTLWERESGEKIHTFTLSPDDIIIDAAFSPDGRTLVTGSLKNRVQMWDVVSGELLRTYTGHSDNVQFVAFSPDGGAIASCGEGGEVRVWDIQLDTEPRQLRGFGRRVNEVAFSPDGRLLLTTDDDFEFVKMWDVASGEAVAQLPGHTEASVSLTFAPGGTRAATAGWDGLVRIWDVETATELLVFQKPTSFFLRIVFSPNGRLLLTGNAAGLAQLWDADTGEEVRRFEGHGQGEIWSVAFSADGSAILTGGSDGTARLWDATSGDELLNLSEHDGGVMGAFFLPDGDTILTTAIDQKARVWDRQSGKLLRQFPIEIGRFTKAALSADGQFLFLGGGDHVVHRYEVAIGTETGRYAGHSEAVFGLSLSPGGHQFATGSWDGTVRLWRAEIGELVEFVREQLPRELTAEERTQYGLDAATND